MYDFAVEKNPTVHDFNSNRLCPVMFSPVRYSFLAGEKPSHFYKNFIKKLFFPEV